MKAAIYTRVSTDEQKKNFSLSHQKEKCLERINENGWQFYKEYKDDGWSAKDLNRPAMQLLIRDIEEKKIDAVVVFALDRFVRSVGDMDYFLKLFDRTGVVFEVVNQYFETKTPFGQTMANQAALWAQHERNMITERMLNGKEMNSKKGGWNGGPAPYGYDLIDKKLVINKEEAKAVRFIYESYLNQLGSRQIINELIAKNYPPPRNRNNWTRERIFYILNNEIYTGKMVWGKHSRKRETVVADGKHEAIISEEMWNKVQKVLERKRWKKKGLAINEYVFSGVLRCSRCGKGFTGKKDKRKKADAYFFYRCNYQQEGRCDLPSVPESSIEEAFFNYDWVLDEINLTDFKSNSDKEYRIKQIESKIKQLHNRIERWQIAYGDGVISLDNFKKLMNRNKNEEEELKRELEEIKNQQEKITQEDLYRFIQTIKSIKDVWDDLPRTKKKLIIQEMVEEIIIDTLPRIPGKRTKVKIIDMKIKK